MQYPNWRSEAIYEEDFVGFSYGFRPGRNQQGQLSLTGVDPAQDRIPLQTASAASPTACAASYPEAHAAAAAAATSATSATATSTAAPTTGMACAGAKGAMRTPHRRGGQGAMRAPHHRGCMRRAAAATAAAAAASTSGCKLYAGTKFSFFVEDVKGRQADVEDFLLGEKNFGPEPCDGTSTAGVFADVPPAIVKETPAAPNTGKVTFERFRFKCFFACLIEEPPCGSSNP